MKPRKIRRYGWKPQLPDPRDYQLTVSLPEGGILDRGDLRSTGFMPPVYDQGNIGSCTANAIAAAVAYEHASQASLIIEPSRLFIYANERIAEGTPLGQDSGACIRDGVSSVARQGVCLEQDWPYIESAFSVQPPQNCYEDALQELALEYCSVSDEDIESMIAAGYPVIVGVSVFESFESASVASTGVMPMPADSEQCVGGHAVLVVGYDKAAGTLTVRNSWGDSWGMKGYFTMPREYLSKYGSDFWVIKKVS